MAMHGHQPPLLWTLLDLSRQRPTLATLPPRIISFRGLETASIKMYLSLQWENKSLYRIMAKSTNYYQGMSSFSEWCFTLEGCPQPIHYLQKSHNQQLLLFDILCPGGQISKRGWNPQNSHLDSFLRPEILALFMQINQSHQCMPKLQPASY